MEYKQVAGFVNAALGEFDGTTAVLNEDLSNVIETGNEVFSGKVGVDNFVRAIVDKIGKTIYASDEHRTYRGAFPDVMKTGAQYGSITEKIRLDYPEAEDSQVYDLQPGDVPEDFQFNPPTAHEKFYNDGSTWKIKVSIMKKQLRSAFTTADRLAAFVSYVFKTVETQITRQIEALTSKLYTCFIADTLYTEYSGSGYGAASKVKAVNLLYLYNQTVTTPITAAAAMVSKDFYKFACMTITMYKKWLAGFSRLYNIGGTLKFTPEANQRLVVLSDFAKGAAFYLESDTYHNDMVKLPGYAEVPYWQGSGNNASAATFSTRSKVYCTTPDNHAVEQTGILAILYDEESLGINLADRYADTAHSAAGQFDNYFEFVEQRNFVDEDENFIVFFIADAA